MTDIDKIIERVQRLDKEATPGPWQTRFLYRLINAVRKSARRMGLAFEADGAKDWVDSELAATFRTDAPALAREVERQRGLLASVATLDRDGSTFRLSVRLPDTAYRPGLPTVEHVQAHEARGGWWQVRRNEQCLPQWASMRVTEDRVEVHWDWWPAGVWSCPSRSNDTGAEWLCRPVVMPDGTPCPWTP